MPFYYHNANVLLMTLELMFSRWTMMLGEAPHVRTGRSWDRMVAWVVERGRRGHSVRFLGPCNDITSWPMILDSSSYEEALLMRVTRTGRAVALLCRGV